MTNSVDSNLNQIFLNQLGQKHSGWLYDLYVQSNNDAVIHLPLIYLTKLRLQHELYSHALCQFPVILQAHHCFQPGLIDGAVVKFPLERFEGFKEYAFNLITNNLMTIKKFFKLSILLKKWLPLACIKAEKEFLLTNKISSTQFKKLFEMISTAIAINLSNPFVEQVFLQMNESRSTDKEFQLKTNEILWAPIFSHLTFYNNRFNLLKKRTEEESCSEQEILKFCWEVAFLENLIGDGSELENPETMVTKIGYKNPLTTQWVDPESLMLPEIVFDPCKISDVIPDDQEYHILLIKFLRLLQVNEEFRHYWGLRVVRLFRLLAPDNEAIQNWGVKEYDEYLKK